MTGSKHDGEWCFDGDMKKAPDGTEFFWPRKTNNLQVAAAACDADAKKRGCVIIECRILK